MKAFADDKSNVAKMTISVFDKEEITLRKGENAGKFFYAEENTVDKGDIVHNKQFLLFPVFSKDLYCRHVKTQACLGKV